MSLQEEKETSGMEHIGKPREDTTKGQTENQGEMSH